MPACAVALCRNYTKTTKGTTVKYFSFPKDPAIQKEWVLRCGRDTKFNVNNSRICSEHFTQDDFERDLMNELLGLPIKRTLKPSALPSINIKAAVGGLRIRSVISNASTITATYPEDVNSDSVSSVQNAAEDENGKQQEDVLVAYHCIECARTNSCVVSKRGLVKKVINAGCREHKCKKSKRNLNGVQVNLDGAVARRGVRKRKSWSRATAFSSAQTSSDKLRAENLKLKKQLREMRAVLNCDENKTDWESLYKDLKTKYDQMEIELNNCRATSDADEMIVRKTVDFHEYAMKPIANDAVEKLRQAKDSVEVIEQFEDNVTFDQPIYIIEIPSEDNDEDTVFLREIIQ